MRDPSFRSGKQVIRPSVLGEDGKREGLGLGLDSRERKVRTRATATARARPLAMQGSCSRGAQMTENPKGYCNEIIKIYAQFVYRI